MRLPGRSSPHVDLAWARRRAGRGRRRAGRALGAANAVAPTTSSPPVVRGLCVERRHELARERDQVVVGRAVEAQARAAETAASRRRASSGRGPRSRRGTPAAGPPRPGSSTSSSGSANRSRRSLVRVERERPVQQLRGALAPAAAGTRPTPRRVDGRDLEQEAERLGDVRQAPVDGLGGGLERVRGQPDARRARTCGRGGVRSAGATAVADARQHARVELAVARVDRRRRRRPARSTPRSGRAAAGPAARPSPSRRGRRSRPGRPLDARERVAQRVDGLVRRPSGAV